MTSSVITSCMACGSDKLKLYCDLHHQPPANNLKNTKNESETLYPLAVNYCQDCYHSQLTVAVDRDILYKHYLYVSGTSSTLREDFSAVANLIDKQNTSAGRRVLDIACNDGTFLKAFRKLGWEAYGIDPAENLVAEIQDEDLNVVCDYWPSDTFRTTFDAITCFNVVAHIPDPLKFLEGCKRALTSNGKIYIQTSQKEMVKNGEFDTIYHEHHSFFTISSMNELCKRAGLSLVDVQERSVHGKSYLFIIQHSGQDLDHINQLLEEESYNTTPETYDRFTLKVLQNKQRLINIIENSKNKVVGYGAAAKGVVMSNYVGIPIDYIVDENPLKIGKVIGGINIPIVGPDKLLEEQEDLTIIVYAWNFYDEVFDKIKRLRPNNSDVIVCSLEK